jgi:hypothetical protein
MTSENWMLVYEGLYPQYPLRRLLKTSALARQVGSKLFLSLQGKQTVWVDDYQFKSLREARRYLQTKR